MSPARSIAKRQRNRKLLLLISLLLFPVTINYMSPYLIVDGAARGIINGSFVLFSLLFLSSLFLGRAWCGWVCPMGGITEACIPIQNKTVSNKVNWIKWVIWFAWLGAIIGLAALAGGYQSIDLFYNTDFGISVSRPEMYVIYYGVIGLFMLFSLTVGKKAGCHIFCWMAPFMILGRKIRNLVNLPALQLEANSSDCISCKSCSLACPMSLDVNQMVIDGNMEDAECILCASCVDSCPKDVIQFTFGKIKK